MRILPIELTAELTKDFFIYKHLFIFDWLRTQRWTDNGNDIYYGGNWYLSRDITFDSIALSMNPKVDQITVKIDDTDKSISKIILSEDIKDRRCWIYSVALNKNLEPIATPTLLFLGYCDSSSKPISSKKFGIEIYNDMIKWQRLTPRRLTSPTCQWDFKHVASKVLGTDSNTYTCKLDHVAHSTNKPTTGANYATYWTLTGSGGSTWIDGDWYLVGTCRYAGAEAWCDRSWERCLALTNTINSGGFRWLPGLFDKEINWGSGVDHTAKAIIAYKKSQ